MHIRSSDGLAAPSCAALQVFDLSRHKPAHVLETIWANFAEHEDEDAEKVGALRERLRVVAAGGDGTVAWILQVRATLGRSAHAALQLVGPMTGCASSEVEGQG